MVSALRWLAYSEVHMTIEMLREACITDHSREPFVDEESRPAIEDLLHSLSSLVRIGDGDDLGHTNDSHGARIQLAHFSVKEYLASVRIRCGSVSRFALSGSQSHYLISQDCVAYLLHCSEQAVLHSSAAGPSRGSTATQGNSPPVHRLNISYPLLKTAAYWAYYQQSAEENDVSCLCSELQYRLFEDEMALDLCHRVLLAEYADQGFVPSIVTKKMVRYHVFDQYTFSKELAAKSQAGRDLILAVFAGLINTARQKITPAWQGPGSANNAQLALIAATWVGHTELVESLLNAGADVNHTYDKNGCLLTPLWLACSRDHEEVARVLLKHNAEPNPENAYDIGSGGTALQQACNHYHLSLVDTLLQYGADPNGVHSDNGRPPIFAAARSQNQSDTPGMSRFSNLSDPDEISYLSDPDDISDLSLWDAAKKLSPSLSERETQVWMCTEDDEETGMP